MHKTICRAATAALLAAALLPAAASAAYPERPIRLMLPFPAGGPGDIVGRMSEIVKWGQVVKAAGITAD